jgi:hypothetical protein
MRSSSLPLTGSASKSTDSKPSLLRKDATILTPRPFWSALAPADDGVDFAMGFGHGGKSGEGRDDLRAREIYFFFTGVI